MLSGGVFKAVGSASPATVAAKGRYMLEHDLPRFAARYGVPLNANPHFPSNTLSLMRTALAARQLGCLEACVLAPVPPMPKRKAQIRVNLMKSGARIWSTVCKVWLSCSEACPSACDIAQGLANLQRHPAWSPPGYNGYGFQALH